jgi:hypothetical protein
MTNKTSDLLNLSPQKKPAPTIFNRKALAVVPSDSAGMSPGAKSPAKKATGIAPERPQTARIAFSRAPEGSAPLPHAGLMDPRTGKTHKGHANKLHVTVQESAGHLGLTGNKPPKESFQPIGTVKTFRPLTKHIVPQKSPERRHTKALKACPHYEAKNGVAHVITHHAEEVINQPKSLRSPVHNVAPWEKAVPSPRRKLGHLENKPTAGQHQHNKGKGKGPPEFNAQREHHITKHIEHAPTPIPMEHGLNHVTVHQEHIKSPKKVMPDYSPRKRWQKSARSDGVRMGPAKKPPVAIKNRPHSASVRRNPDRKHHQKRHFRF